MVREKRHVSGTGRFSKDSEPFTEVNALERFAKEIHDLGSEFIDWHAWQFLGYARHELIEKIRSEVQQHDEP